MPSYMNKFNALDAKTKVFEVEVQFKRMYEVPDQALEAKAEDVVEHNAVTESVKSEGVPAGEQDDEQIKEVPRETVRKEQTSKTKSIQHHRFFQDEDGSLYLWGGDPYGTFRIDARNAIAAMGRRGYHLNTVLDLLQITPQWINITGGDHIDGTDTVLEKRVMKFGREFRVPVKYDYIGKGLLPNSHTMEREQGSSISLSPLNVRPSPQRFLPLCMLCKVSMERDRQREEITKSRILELSPGRSIKRFRHSSNTIKVTLSSPVRYTDSQNAAIHQPNSSHRQSGQVTLYIFIDSQQDT